MLRKDYKKLYNLQDSFFNLWKTLDLPFYLTGGTALGRFYLKHRHSEDLDFFVNDDNEYPEHIKKISTALNSNFNIDKSKTVTYENFTRFFIQEDDSFLKIEFINDIGYRSGKPEKIFFGLIDTPLNILSNKIYTLISRDEPKDMFDIIHIALKYCFNWKTVFFETKEKNIVNEIEIEQRINSFPVELFSSVNWLIKDENPEILKRYIRQMADDFIIGADNSLCTTNIKIEDAKPNVDI